MDSVTGISCRLNSPEGVKYDAGVGIRFFHMGHFVMQINAYMTPRFIIEALQAWYGRL
jgi:hypothetical protein